MISSQVERRRKSAWDEASAGQGAGVVSVELSCGCG
jgi:hypothetical protein